MPMQSAALVALTLGLAACAGQDLGPGPDTYLYAYGRTTRPRPENFVHCYGFTCRITVETSVTVAELQKVGTLFQTPSRTPLEERRRLAQAVALFEEIVGAKTGTSADVGSETGDRMWNDLFQQDCMDETFNTTSYLMMMNDAGWLRFHTVIYPASRGIQNGFVAPHHAATLLESASKRRFVVDSWFYDNGKPPVVMPVEIWEKGWYPSTHPMWRDE
jgi:hypothetical protein